MERVGLVAQVEQQLERVIALGRLPRCGTFGSEEKLARSYGVSRTTVREALRRLAARGLVVQHPGRKTQARALDESLTLENLGLALHDERSLVSRRLLEGYFSLKRQVTVELLADCATHASKAALQQLGDACFALWDVACLRLGERCVQMEFELLKLAAWALDRPGHLLLIQSLQRAFQGIAARVLPLVECEVLGQWASWAMNALHERDAEALQRKLPALLRACDERVLSQLAPVIQEEALHLQRGNERVADCTPEARGLDSPTPATEEEAAPEAGPIAQECGLDRCVPAAEEDDSFEARPTSGSRVAGHPTPAAEEDDAFEAPSIMEARGPGHLAPAAEGRLPGEAFTNPSNCRTGSCASRPEVSLQPVVARTEGGPPLDSGGQHPPLPVAWMTLRTPSSDG
jgi:DNA-binding FadR family transcriptional regulator